MEEQDVLLEGHYSAVQFLLIALYVHVDYPDIAPISQYHSFFQIFSASFPWIRLLLAQHGYLFL